MPSKQIEFLDRAVNTSPGQAIAEMPDVLAAGEADLIRNMSKEQIQKLKELREYAESPNSIDAVHGSGYLSM